MIENTTLIFVTSIDMYIFSFNYGFSFFNPIRFASYFSPNDTISFIRELNNL